MEIPAFRNKRLLLISPKTFNYEIEIQQQLERMGAIVDWYDDRPSSSTLSKALIRYKPSLMTQITNRYVESIIQNAHDKKYDIVFVIKGEAMSGENIERLQAFFSSARFVYYTWDSLRNFKNGSESLKYFEKKYSFDPSDCGLFENVKHLPLFFLPAYAAKKMSQTFSSVDAEKIDLLFLGSLHSDRYEVFQAIMKACQVVHSSLITYSHLYFQSKWVFFLKRLTDKKFNATPLSAINWQPLSQKQTQELIFKSKIVIDVHHPYQTGLTMRTIECLGAQRKLITTNENVKYYEFYDPQNIHIVDRNNPVVDRGFIELPYAPVHPDITNQYRLDNWLKKILL
jgi:hypothetical protein